MNERERFCAALLFNKPDRVPLAPGSPRESTLAAWHRQGLPEGVVWHEHLMEVLDIPYVPPTQLQVDLSVDFKMIPTFEEKVLEHRDGHYIVQDWMGAITEISDRYDYTYIRVAKDFVTRKWHRFPVDFEARCVALSERDGALRLTVNGPFWQLREWCGLENLCLLMVDDPGFVQEMVDFWADFVLQTLEPILTRVTPDFVQVGEDMAYKMHSMISPTMTRWFLLPVWKRWVDAIKASGCPIVSMDSDGYMAELMPLWIEAGFNCCFPVEVAAGNDIVAYRREYGKRMAYLGGLDKRALAVGGETMRAELLRVVPTLLEEGGFIPGCDHGVPPDISWPNFVEYTRLLARLTGWL